MREKIGLVLTGGGGKGAYHIGVWKALREFGVDKNIYAVSGTSIGALNAVLFIQGDYNKAEEIWLSLSQEKIMSHNLDKIAVKLAEIGLEKLAIWITELKHHGWFSRKGLLTIIDDDINLSCISRSDILSYVTCCETGSLRAKYFKLNGCSNERITKILLASSALPLLYAPVEIDGKKYIDGGIPVPNADNVPITPLYEEGCRLIFVLHLSRSNLVDHNKFSESRIIEIVPQESLGGIFSGTLDFTPGAIRRRIEAGYKDTMLCVPTLIKILQNYNIHIEKLH
ncbi:MAG: patatin [Alkaliphilus sp.]|nr:MAG: patatin [Alkaliphilus sp.]